MVNIPNSPFGRARRPHGPNVQCANKNGAPSPDYFHRRGAMMDFGPLIANPSYMILGLFSQLGIFIAFFVAILFGFDIPSAASIASIGTADGPTSIYVASKLKT